MFAKSGVRERQALAGGLHWAGDETGELEPKDRKESEDCLFDSHWPACA